YKAGELLPTENELINRYGISRITVRKALDLLSKDGLIAKRRGYGTFVQAPKVEQTLTRVLHFANEMEKRGRKTSTAVLANKTVLAHKTIAEGLGIEEGSELILVSRLRLADGVPLCMESAYLIKERCPLVLEQDFSTASLRKFLIDNYNISWQLAKQKIFAVTAAARQAKHLKIKAGDPLIYIERISYDQYNRAGEYLEAYYRGDSYYLTADLNARSMA
ncbi:MAG: GntR family transcriptional regulator, partial [Planctomycetes bacterium]|nr:GntR family transcriptional regulator [Planctomycetota bacterium]